MALKRADFELSLGWSGFLSPFSSYTTSQLDVLGHDRHSLGVDRAQIRVLEQADQISLAGLLQGHDGRALEAQIGLEVLSDLPNETLEREFTNQQLGTLLVATDLSQGDCPWPVTMGLLHSARRWSALSRSLRRQLLPGSLASG